MKETTQPIRGCSQDTQSWWNLTVFLRLDSCSVLLYKLGRFSSSFLITRGYLYSRYHHRSLIKKKVIKKSPDFYTLQKSVLDILLHIRSRASLLHSLSRNGLGKVEDVINFICILPSLTKTGNICQIKQPEKCPESWFLFFWKNRTDGRASNHIYPLYVTFYHGCVRG